MTTKDSKSDTIAEREGFELDRDALDAWMRSYVDGYQGPLDIAQFSGGQSNPTYRISTPGRNYVLRRKPPGKLLKGAHAVEREVKVLVGLEKADFPVPHVYGLCDDRDVVGTEFYVMDLVEGRIFWNSRFPDVPTEQRAAYFDAMNATIAQLHNVDYEAVGLGDYGKAGNYFERQIGRWSGQYAKDVEAGRDANMDKLIEWLETNIPASEETSIVHGDFRCDNMIFHPTEPKVIAVLDWELSTLGNPLSDFAYHAMMYEMPDGMSAGLLDADLAAENIPSQREYVDAYCRRTGRDGIANWNFYLAFNLFRLAAILHGIKGRIIRGTASSAQAEQRAAAFPAFAELGWKMAQRSE